MVGYPWFRGEGKYPLPAYSEFMPPPRVGRKPCGEIDRTLFADGDDFGWRISEREEMRELRPGLQRIGAHLLHEMVRIGGPAHERYVIIAPLALSRTQDDKGRVRWTLFGGSEYGPAVALDREFIDRLLIAAYGETSGFHEGVPKSLRGVRYVLTFTPFALLPQQLKDAYRAGDVHLIPFPESLSFWNDPGYAELQRALPLATQIPLLHCTHRHEAPGGIRVPQSGWLHVRTASSPDPHPGRGPFRETFQRTHRWAKVGRDEDELDLISPIQEKLVHVLFSTSPDDLDLYDKPMARNVQIWTAHHEPVLDGPRATPEQLRAAAERVCAGGTFGYRFFYPPMQVGPHAIFWHRPLVGFVDRAEQPQVMVDAPLGTLSGGGVQLSPRLGPSSPPKAATSRRTPRALTFDFTTTPEFKQAYWDTIEVLSNGKFINKDNADIVLDRPTRKRLRHRERDLEPLAQTLIAHYRKLGIQAEAMRFQWRTDFPFDWSEGWLRNQKEGIECDVIARIPGRNRKRAVIMADHYDTAYMEDVYRTGARIAAPGADDNASATAALLLAAPMFLELRPACDIWLVHLTGEEFPSDCLGARALVQRLVEGTIDVEVSGAFVLDMIAHNNRKHPDIFQISPGEGRRARELAQVASEVTQMWKQKRLRGEVRLHDDPRSTLYNTDAQIFSDAGLPVVLFMENYDIDRKGYHDSHDTMENIDLDYGATVAAIAIETVAQVATV